MPRRWLVTAARDVWLDAGGSTEAVARVVETRNWSRKTGREVLSVVLSGRHAKTSNKVLADWEQCIRKATHNRSALSLRNILCFFKGPVLRALQIDLAHWPPEDTERAAQVLLRDEGVICGQQRKKHLWLQLFVTHILKSTQRLKLSAQGPILAASWDSREDRHRLSPAELDRINVFAKQDSLDELLFLMLLTTGMRIGAFASLKRQAVAELIDGRWHAKPIGSAREKNNKRFSFHLHPRVRELLESWLQGVEEGIEYVFPSRVRSRVCLSTEALRMRFRRLCTRAGLHGPHLHPHSLRHTFAHMMLALGNAPDLVSKLLNHSGVTTTQMYYLRESTADVSNRATLPWLPRSDTIQQAVPAFLQASPRLEEELDLLLTE